MKIEELISLCIKDLEEQGIKVGTTLEELKLEHKRFTELRELLGIFRLSKLSAVYQFKSFSKEEKENFMYTINSVLNNPAQTNEIITEMANLFYLKKEGLLELDEVAPQREKINRTLESFINTLEAYIDRFDIKDYDKKLQSLSNEMDRIMKLGTALSTTKDSDKLSLITDIPFFKSVVEHLNVSEEAKLKIITFAINHNNKIYENSIKKKQDKIREKEEEPIKEEKDTSSKEVISSLPQNILDEIEELLKKPEVIEKIVKIINDDYETSINFSNPTDEQKELIDQSINFAREEIIETIMENKSISPQEALQAFYDEYDLESKKKTIELRNILKNTETSSLTERKQQLLIRQAYEFYEKHKILIPTLTKMQQDIINRNMMTSYSDYNKRTKTYKSKLSNNTSNYQVEAVYEIGYMLDLIENLDSKEDDASILMSKAAKRIEEVFLSLSDVLKSNKTESQDEENNEVKKTRKRRTKKTKEATDEEEKPKTKRK